MAVEPEIHVRHSGTVRFPSYKRDGAVLVPVEAEGTLPFPMRRVYFTTNLGSSPARGGHAHRKADQVIACVKGSFELVLDDGENTQTIILSDPTLGIRLGPSLWSTLKNFSEDCVIIVYADRPNDEKDYIRSYDDFLAFIGKKP
ncbi:FdtA/QdtA family cupin domain-containing protein [Candidatus Parcubacteria bacterium]|nr:FdtA/QdtA family cupin domain-containing protein [Candidatus Parcubacteria bacterium]